MKPWILLATLAILTHTALADLSDDAEARRRGVPVSLILAEKALADQKSKVAAMEKELAALNAQLSGMKPTATPSNTRGDELPTPAGAKILMLDLGAGATLKLLRIPAGIFKMGSTTEQNSNHSELMHEVTISKSYFMGLTLVTVDQFSAFVKATGYQTQAEKEDNTDDKIWAKGSFVGLENTDHTWRRLAFAQTGRHPVVNISWDDAQAFCDWLGKKTAKAVSLPTEAQWEFAAHGGTKTRYIWGDRPDQGNGWANCAGAEVNKLLPYQGIRYNYACYDWNDGYLYTSPVGSFKPNGYGLFDMIGNASEWCLDGWGDYKPDPVTDPLVKSTEGRVVKRGSNWTGFEDEGQPSHRSWAMHDDHDSTSGMRIVVNE